ncbi:MAG: formylglycine-generating enzyme family protein [Candidatus Brocadiia bacterium]
MTNSESTNEAPRKPEPNARPVHVIPPAASGTDNEHWAMALREGKENPDIWRQHMEKFPECPHKRFALLDYTFAHDRAFSKVKDICDICAIEAFLARFPKTERGACLMKRIEQLDRELWEKAESAESYEAVRNYLALPHRSKGFAGSAQARLNREKEEREAWKSASAAGTPGAMLQYVEEWSEHGGVNIREAKEVLAPFDDEWWDRVRGESADDGIQGYLDAFGAHARHKEEALSRLNTRQSPAQTRPAPSKKAEKPVFEDINPDSVETGSSNVTREMQVPVISNMAKIDLVPIHSGNFMMGSDRAEGKEKPVHKVILTRDFLIGKHLVTQAQYELVMGLNPSSFAGADLPLENESWDDAVAFCKRLTEIEHKAKRLPKDQEYRLPTEAEWEYCCRAGSKTEYFFGSDEKILGEYAWFKGNSGGKTHPVGTRKPNSWGLFDMYGNVWEWCLDWYVGVYPSGEQTDPTGPDEGDSRVLRGGSWDYESRNCRSAFRGRGYPEGKDRRVGFRVVCAPVTERK